MERVKRFGRSSDYLRDLLVGVRLGRFQRCALRTFAHDTLLGNRRIGIAIGRLKRSLVAGGDTAIEAFIFGFQLFDIREERGDILLDSVRFTNGILYLFLQLVRLGSIVFAIEPICQLFDRIDGYFLFFMPITVHPIRELRRQRIGSFAEPRFQLGYASDCHCIDVLIISGA